MCVQFAAGSGVTISSIEKKKVMPEIAILNSTNTVRGGQLEPFDRVIIFFFFEPVG